MCRVFGIIYGPEGSAAEPKTPKEIAAIMFPALVKKGPHAYGWMANIDGEVWFDKHSGRCDTEEAAAAIDKGVPDECKWLIGHTRWATHGSPEDNRNNHPILHGDIMGVHNGVLRNHEQILAETGREDPKTVVDSEAIFASVHAHGVRKGLTSIEGDMVTIFANVEKPNTVNIAKSHGRPLVYATTKAGSLIFASEEQAIIATGLPLRGKIAILSVNTLLKVRQGQIKERITYQTTPAPFRPAKRQQATRVTGARKEWESEYLRRRHEERQRELLPVRNSRGQDDLRWGHQDQRTGLFWFKDSWMSEQEYVAAVMDELDFPYS